MLEKLLGKATGIGSMPHKTAEPALEAIFSAVPEIPHWPQLPATGEEEGFIRQYLNPLLQRGLLRLSDDRPPTFDTLAGDWIDRLTRFYEEVLEREDSYREFGFPREAAAGFYAFKEHIARHGAGEAICLKGQLSGPVTIGLQTVDAGMTPAFYNEDIRDILVRSLAEQVSWQVQSLKEAGLPVLLFIDDPSIYSYGQSTFVGLSREAIQQSLIPLIDAAHRHGALVGVHACAGVDWTLLFSLPFDIVNIDVYHYFPSLLVCAGEFDSFLERGGALAWGLVPTTDEAWEETADRLFKRLAEYQDTLVRRGVNRERMKRRLLFTPSCGTGSLSVELAEKVYGLLGEVADLYCF